MFCAVILYSCFGIEEVKMTKNKGKKEETCKKATKV